MHNIDVRKFTYLPVRAIDNFVYMMTSSKWRPGTILKKLYSPQNFVPAFLSTVVWSLESQSPGKRTDRASIQSTGGPSSLCEELLLLLFFYLYANVP